MSATIALCERVNAFFWLLMYSGLLCVLGALYFAAYSLAVLVLWMMFHGFNAGGVLVVPEWLAVGIVATYAATLAYVGWRFRHRLKGELLGWQNRSTSA